MRKTAYISAATAHLGGYCITGEANCVNALFREKVVDALQRDQGDGFTWWVQVLLISRYQDSFMVKTTEK